MAQREAYTARVSEPTKEELMARLEEVKARAAAALAQQGAAAIGARLALRAILPDKRDRLEREIAFLERQRMENELVAASGDASPGKGYQE
jgi:hypothetical protein